jgi:hypothetical protein
MVLKIHPPVPMPKTQREEVKAKDHIDHVLSKGAYQTGHRKLVYFK